MLYLWIRALHLVFVIALMGGLLIYPRYKLHQMKSVPGDELFETMREASNRLRKIILNPSLILVWVFGLILLALNTTVFNSGWIYIKLALVLGLSGLHGYLIGMGKKIDAGQKPVSAKALKILNELPFVVMIAIVILVIVKPF